MIPLGTMVEDFVENGEAKCDTCNCNDVGVYEKEDNPKSVIKIPIIKKGEN